jgi:hypothetical protein
MIFPLPLIVSGASCPIQSIRPHSHADLLALFEGVFRCASVRASLCFAIVLRRASCFGVLRVLRASHVLCVLRCASRSVLRFVLRVLCVLRLCFAQPSMHMGHFGRKLPVLHCKGDSPVAGEARMARSKPDDSEGQKAWEGKGKRGDTVNGKRRGLHGSGVPPQKVLKRVCVIEGCPPLRPRPHTDRSAPTQSHAARVTSAFCECVAREGWRGHGEARIARPKLVPCHMGHVPVMQRAFRE